MIARIADALLGRRRLWLAAAALLTAIGIVAWRTMPREEDPRLPERFGTLIVPYPGADALSVERLVVRPLEDELVEVSAVEQVRATARDGVAIVEIELGQAIYDTTAAWDEVERAAEAASRDLPSGAGPWELDHAFNDAEAVIVSLHGDDDPLALLDAAEKVERRLLAIPGAKRTLRAGDPGRQVTVALDPIRARALGLTPALLARQLDSANVTIPGGTLRVDGRTLAVRARGEQGSVAEIAVLPVLLPSGAAIRVADIADVRLEALSPPEELAWHDGRRTVSVSVVPEPGIDVVAFGERARAAIEAARADVAPLELTVFADQPAQVEARLSDLGFSLLLGIGIIVATLFLAMGARLGLVVASVVPLVTFTTVALYAMGGGVLHQLSIAALVVALGLLVDNAIVVAEAVQRRIDEGEERWAAARGAVVELAIPLATATGTTLASFVPMLLSPGTTADFTRAIPVVILVALAVSYVFAVLITPILGAWGLRPSRRTTTGALDRLGARVAALATGRPWAVLGAVGAVLALSAGLGSQVDAEFFPFADRARFVATVELPAGADLDETARAAHQVEAWARTQPGVVGVDTYVGRAAPRFYYNIPQSPRAQHVAAVVITTDTAARVPSLVAETRAFGLREVPEGVVVARRLQQGPPVRSPVEVRLLGEDLGDLAEAADRVVAAVRSVAGTAAVRHDLGIGLPTVEIGIDDAAAARRGATRGDVAAALLGQTRGLDASPYRALDEATPLRVRGPRGLDTTFVSLVATDVGTARGPVPLSAVASSTLRWAPATVTRLDRERVVTVSAELDPGFSFGAVDAPLRAALADVPLPPGVRVAFGGEVESSGEANGALLGALPIGGLLLLGCLLLEFNSFRRVAIVLGTVPLAAVGVLPGLVLGGQPFGFMSLLGVIALVGIVVNNAIVLLDVVDRRLEAGDTVNDAVARAVRDRLRPILLTTGTTVAGLVPLALSESSLWPPLATAMISGLLASTLLTLLVVPALARLTLAPHRPTA